MTKWRFAVVITVIMLSLVPAGVLSAQRTTYGEFDVKVAFIYNFLKFVEWPQIAGAQIGRIRICALGNVEIEGKLGVLRGKTIGGAEIEIGGMTNMPEPECRAVFVTAADKGRLGQILKACRGRPILTIGDGEGFAKEGVMINFYTAEGMVRFEINTEAVRQSGLQISSKLLRLARIVK